LWKGLLRRKAPLKFSKEEFLQKGDWKKPRRRRVLTGTYPSEGIRQLRRIQRREGEGRGKFSPR